MLMYVLVIVLLALSTALMFAYGASQRRLHGAELRLKMLSEECLATRDDERRRLARDLHDDLGQLLTAICIDVDRAAGLADDGKRRSALGYASQSAQTALDRIRTLSAELRTSVVDELGLDGAVQRLLADFESRHSGAFAVEVTSAPVPPAVGEQLYRILQEALNNVTKYARGSRVEVTLQATDGRASVSVRDTGAGFRTSEIRPGALGLLGMRERVALLGGELAITSAQGRGTHVVASFPVAWTG